MVRKILKHSFIKIVVISILFTSCNKPTNEIQPSDENTLFSLVDSQITNIHFKNKITDFLNEIIYLGCIDGFEITYKLPLARFWKVQALPDV